MLLDIDHFKRVNDQHHGHLQGDKVLCAVARVLQDSLRSQDIAGRWGEEKFLVPVLPSARPALQPWCWPSGCVPTWPARAT